MKNYRVAGHHGARGHGATHSVSIAQWGSHIGMGLPVPTRELCAIRANNHGNCISGRGSNYGVIGKVLLKGMHFGA
nr:hypothetical protein [Tanacetum cinerariifolium]